MNRIQTLIDKEWAEVFKNRTVLFTTLLVPLIMTLLPLAVLYFTGSSMTGEELGTTDMPAQFARSCGAMSAKDCMQIYLVNQFLLMYMIIPLSIPSAIASYSIVGEKTTRSLEPLLATPITTAELLAGKSLAAVLPGVGATWVCFALFLVLLPVLGISQAVIGYIAGATWLIAVIIIGPLMAIASSNLAVIVSSRMNDPRAAEQISALLIIPLMGVLFAQLGGLLIINTQLMLYAICVMVLLDVGLIYFGSKIFQREHILTRWK